MLMHVNIWKEDTFLWLIEKMDVPWVPTVWNSLREKAYKKNPSKKNDTTVFGKYLSQMKLNQWKKYGWADTEKAQQEAGLRTAADEELQKAQQQMYQQQFENGEITQAQYRTLVDADQQRKFDLKKEGESISEETKHAEAVGIGNFYNEDDFIAEEDIPDLSVDLTEDDKKYLVMKWGRLYKPQEWIQLQNFYKQMTDSFDIQDADTRSTLILICKNNLKMNQAIDQGDLEGYQKLARVSDTLRKSAKFTAAQNKQQKSEFIDSVGELVDYCQKNGGEIPKLPITVDYDVVDTIINDLKAYNKSLVYEDTALARQIEEYLRKRQYIENQKKDLEEAKVKGLSNVEISDEDIRDYNNEIQNQKNKDQQLIEKG